MQSEWFECKVRYDKTLESGLIKKTTETYLVDALSFTEAEKRFIEEIEPFMSGEFMVTDIKRARITDLFDNMVEAGNSIFLIEHNIDMLKACDYLVELGPGGGAMGGRIIFAGTPKAMSECPDSVTGIYL